VRSTVLSPASRLPRTNADTSADLTGRCPNGMSTDSANAVRGPTAASSARASAGNGATGPSFPVDLKSSQRSAAGGASVPSAPPVSIGARRPRATTYLDETQQTAADSVRLSK
jgi:hypothetical protein